MTQPHDNDGAAVETVADATTAEAFVRPRGPHPYKSETQAIDALAKDSST